jgi:hypothetical protein
MQPGMQVYQLTQQICTVNEPTPLELLEGDLTGGDWRCDASDMPTRTRFVRYIMCYYSHNWSSICQRVQALGAKLRFDLETACLIEAAYYSQAEHMLAYSFKRLYAIRIQALPASCLCEGSAPVAMLPTVLEQLPMQMTTAAPTAVTAAAEASAIEQCSQHSEQQQQQRHQVPPLSMLAAAALQWEAARCSTVQHGASLAVAQLNSAAPVTSGIETLPTAFKQSDADAIAANSDSTAAFSDSNAEPDVAEGSVEGNTAVAHKLCADTSTAVESTDSDAATIAAAAAAAPVQLQ